MTIKKNPSYRITVYNQKETIVIEYPITCKFTSERGTFSKSNKCTIDLYNLASKTREAIFKDALTLDKESWKYIKLEAGWNGQLSQIFMGKILQAYSTKNGGQVDIITHIECQPFDIFESNSEYTFAEGTTYKDAYKTMAADLPNVVIGNIGKLEGTFKTQTTFSGKTLDCLNTLTGGNTYVDNGVLNTIMSNEVIDIPVPLVTDDNGLLQTPIRRDATLTIKMLFEPSLIVGQLLEIKSIINDAYNGQYKVLGFTHDCLISPTQAGSRTTTVELWIAPLLASTDINITNEEVTGRTGFDKVEKETVTQAVLNPSRTKWIMPCKGRITAPYKEQRLGYKHEGIDIGVGIGTPIKAIADGTICAVGKAKGYGLWVAINHGKVNGKKVTSEYGHISRWVVKYGQRVKQGDIIAYSGNTGKSTGPHLHLTLREGAFQGKAVNPTKYIS